jgi:MSHA pilin protein MshA
MGSVAPFAADVLRMRGNISVGTLSPPSRGFSLIEVVVLISLIGILAAFALPRLTHLANDARASEIQALGAHLESTAQLAHAQFLASGSHLLTTTIEGRTVTLKDGYPDLSTEGIRNTVSDSDGFTASEGEDFVRFSRTDAPSVGQCVVIYRVPRDGSAAIITNIDTSGC